MNLKAKHYLKEAVSSVEIPECLNDVKAKYFKKHKEVEYDYDNIYTVKTRRRWFFMPFLASSILISLLSVALIGM
ncbi:MAG: hypothetical protein FWG51_02485 [Firmicutes bacterium]|nr:hypothetical protein [Bacillota bacterium]